MYSRPDLLHKILSVTADAVTSYLNAQIDSGAQAVMIFDTWGGSLSAAAYQEFSLAYMQRIVAGLKKEKDGQRIPSIVFTKNGGLWLEKIAAIGCDGVGLDWTIDIGEARRRVGDKVALQGNIDPNVLFGTPEIIAAETKKGARQLRSGQYWPCLQPGPRHFPIHAAGKCDGAGRNGPCHSRLARK
jgi:uroporphyrinogen decarboxylase